MNPSSIVLIVPQQKDVDVLDKLGFSAIAFPKEFDGWAQWHEDILQGKEVIVVHNADNTWRLRIGQESMSLKEIAKSVRMVELPNSGDDFSSWVTSFKDEEEAIHTLLNLIDQANLYETPKVVNLSDAIWDSKTFCIEVSKLPPRRVILYPWVKENSIILISGWRGTGKSMFALSLLDIITKGASFGPWKTLTSVPCLFLDGEMPWQDLQERIEKLGLYIPHIYSDAYVSNFGFPRANLTSEEWRSNMKHILLSKGVKLWVMDNISSLASGLDENSKQDWDPINHWLLDLRFAGISTIMLHHVSKDGGQRGTSAREDNVDISIILKHPHDYAFEEGARFIVQFTKARITNKDLGLISDIEFKLLQDESGHYQWTWGNVKGKMKREILKMLIDGRSYDEIKKELGFKSGGYITKIKKEAIQKGHLSQDGKLTESGQNFVFGD